jgi:hypothetical protein
MHQIVAVSILLFGMLALWMAIDTKRCLAAMVGGRLDIPEWVVKTNRIISIVVVGALLISLLSGRIP